MKKQLEYYIFFVVAAQGKEAVNNPHNLISRDGSVVTQARDVNQTAEKRLCLFSEILHLDRLEPILRHILQRCPVTRLLINAAR